MDVSDYTFMLLAAAIGEVAKAGWVGDDLVHTLSLSELECGETRQCNVAEATDERPGYQADWSGRRESNPRS